MNQSRVICWFSCGDASAVATVLALKKYRQTHEVVVARIVIPSEHHDNERFSEECQEWFGHPIIRLQSDEYADTWDVWEKRKYIAGINGAPCTGLLKKAVRFKFQRPDDIHVFGYTIEEAKEPKPKKEQEGDPPLSRVARFKKENFELTLDFPLVDNKLSKPDCHALVRAAGIELPMMYRLGFNNNNCIGCPKGGAGYWNMIRRHFPAQFNRMAELSRRLGVRLVKQDGERIFIDELEPGTGRQQDEVDISCSPMCEAVSETIS